MNRTASEVRLLVAVLMALAAVERAMAQEKAPPATPERVVVVNIPALKLELIEAGKTLRTYPIAVGKRTTPTPTGVFHVATRVKNPAWYGKRQVVEPGAANPVGSRWIGLDAKGYGIHGTNAPKSVGKPASHGCIRMRKADVEELFELVRVGDKVEIQYVTVLAGGEVLTDIYQRAAAPAAVPAAAPAAAPVAVAAVASDANGGN